METVDALREAIGRVFAEWEKLPRMPSDWKIASVQDALRDRYTLQNVSFAKDRYDTRLLAYLEIRDGKIWRLTDNTEEGIASELATGRHLKKLHRSRFLLAHSTRVGRICYRLTDKYLNMAHSSVLRTLGGTLHRRVLKTLAVK